MPFACSSESLPTALQPPLLTPAERLLGTRVESSQGQVLPTWEEVPEWNPYPHPQEGGAFRLTFSQPWQLQRQTQGLMGCKGFV